MPTPNKNQRILVVDDDRDILANLSDILNDIGYQTDTAPCGEDAMELINGSCGDACDTAYDLCLLDFNMPGMDGVELYKQIQNHNPNLPAIMITAHAGDDGIERARLAGTWEVLKKPVEIKELLAMIAKAIS